MSRFGKFSIKTFEYPPRPMVLLSMGKTKMEIIMETIAHPVANYDNFLYAFFGGTRKIPFVITYGNGNQFQSNSEFSGNQCTSMSIASLAWWSLGGNIRFFSPRDIDNVLLLGDRWHTYFRKVKILSSETDNRVSLDEIPSQIEADFDGRKILITRCDDDMFLLTSPTETSGGYGLGCLEDFLTAYQEVNNNAPTAYLITVGPFSNGIMSMGTGVWLWFDSHGFMVVNKTNLKKYSSICELASLRHLIMFIVALRGARECCQIVPMKFLEEQEPTEPKKSHCLRFSEQAEAIGLTNMTESECSEPLYTKPVYPRASTPVETPKLADLSQSDSNKPLYTESVYSRCSKPGEVLEITDLTEPGYAEESPENVAIEVAAAPGRKVYESSEADEDSPYVTFMGGFGDAE